MKSQPWYEQNIELFADRTLNIDMTERYNFFLPLLKENAHILEAGCGPGRDVKYFASQGFKVSAYDASPSMVAYAKEYTGQDIDLRTHQDVKEKNQYDGIWCSASFVHTPINELKELFPNFIEALKHEGAWFISLTYGDDSAMRKQGGRYFQDYNEKRLKELIASFPQLQIKHLWRSGIAREGSQNTWISTILTKI